MGRIAGNSENYTFRVCRSAGGDLDPSGRLVKPTEFGFNLRSVTSIIKNVYGPPFGAGAWWGYRMALQGVCELQLDAEALGPEGLEERLRAEGVDPQQVKSEAGDRGTWAHDALELCALGHEEWATDLAVYEKTYQGTAYSWGAISFWANGLKGSHREGAVSERPVWSLKHGYAGTLDLAVPVGMGQWGIIDLKTHKPASGFTKEGLGPAYIADIAQVRAYRMAWEEMGYGPAVKNTVVIARENGTFLEDKREVSDETWLGVIELDRAKREFERGK